MAAICAAPVVLAGMGLLNGRKAVCYPGMEGSMGTADVQVGSKVVVDGDVDAMAQKLAEMTPGGCGMGT